MNDPAQEQELGLSSPNCMQVYTPHYFLLYTIQTWYIRNLNVVFVRDNHINYSLGDHSTKKSRFGIFCPFTMPQITSRIIMSWNLMHHYLPAHECKEKYISPCIPYQMLCLHPELCNNIEQINCLFGGVRMKLAFWKVENGFTRAFHSNFCFQKFCGFSSLCCGLWPI